jgi:hypothetical protein
MTDMPAVQAEGGYWPESRDVYERAVLVLRYDRADRGIEIGVPDGDGGELGLAFVPVAALARLLAEVVGDDD